MMPRMVSLVVAGRRNLLREGVEPNPGPSLLEIKNAIQHAFSDHQPMVEKVFANIVKDLEEGTLSDHNDLQDWFQQGKAQTFTTKPERTILNRIQEELDKFTVVKPSPDLDARIKELEKLTFRLNLAQASATTTTTLGAEIQLRLDSCCSCSTESFEENLRSVSEVPVQNLWESWIKKKISIPEEISIPEQIPNSRREKKSNKKLPKENRDPQNKELELYQPIAKDLFEHLAPGSLKIWSNKSIRSASKKPDISVTGAREGHLSAQVSIFHSELKTNFEKNKLRLYGQLQDYVVSMIKKQSERTVGFGVALDLRTIQILRWDFSKNPPSLMATNEESLLPEATDKISPVPTRGFSLLARLLHTNPTQLGCKLQFAPSTITIGQDTYTVIERWVGGHSEVFSVKWKGELVAVKTRKNNGNYDREALVIQKLASCPAVPKFVAKYSDMLLIKPAGIPLSTVLDPVRNFRVPTASLYLLGAVLVLRLEQIHHEGLLHLDFRPRNIILRSFPELSINKESQQVFSETFWEQNIVIIDWETALNIGTVVDKILGVQMYQSNSWLKAFLNSSAGQQRFAVTVFEDLESLAYTIHSAILTSCGAGETGHSDIASILAHRQGSHLPSFIQKYLNLLNKQRQSKCPDYTSLAELLRQAFHHVTKEEAKMKKDKNEEVDLETGLEELVEEEGEETLLSSDAEESVEVQRSKRVCGATICTRIRGKIVKRKCRRSAACPHHRGGK